jgi:hypothetical protein
MEGLVTCLKGKEKAVIDAMLASLGEIEAEQTRIKLTAAEAKMNHEGQATIDWTKEPSTDVQKAINQSLKEMSTRRDNKKLGVSGIKPLEWQAFKIKVVAMFYSLRACFTIPIGGTNLCALERNCWEQLDAVSEAEWETHFNSFSSFHRSVIDR